MILVKLEISLATIKVFIILKFNVLITIQSAIIGRLAYKTGAQAAYDELQITLIFTVNCICILCCIIWC